MVTHNQHFSKCCTATVLHIVEVGFARGAIHQIIMCLWVLVQLKQNHSMDHPMQVSYGYNEGKNDAVLYTVDPPPSMTDTLGIATGHLQDLSKVNESDFDQDKYDSIELSPELEDNSEQPTPSVEKHHYGHLHRTQHASEYAQATSGAHKNQDYALSKLSTKLDQPTHNISVSMQAVAQRNGHTPLQLARNVSNDHMMWSQDQAKWANRQLQEQDIRHGQVPRDNLFFNMGKAAVQHISGHMQNDAAGILGQSETALPVRKSVGEKIKGFFGKIGTTMEHVAESTMTGVLEGAVQAVAM